MQQFESKRVKRAIKESVNEISGKTVGDEIFRKYIWDLIHVSKFSAFVAILEEKLNLELNPRIESCILAGAKMLDFLDFILSMVDIKVQTQLKKFGTVFF